MSARALARFCFLGAALVALVAASTLIPEPDAESAEPAPPLVVCVLDVSQSERRTRPDWSSWVRSELRTHASAAASDEAEFAVIRFAENVEVVAGSSDPLDWLDRLDGRNGAAWVPVPDGDRGLGSSLTSALEVAAGLAREKPHAALTVSLLSSGGFTGVEPSRAWQQLTALGARLEQRQPPRPTYPDVELIRADLPEGLEPNAPASVRVEIAWQPGRQAGAELILRARVTQGGIELPVQLPVQLPASADRWVVNMPLGEIGFGALVVDVDAFLMQGGRVLAPTPENDRVVARTFVEGERTIACVREPRDAAAAAKWLIPSGAFPFPGIALRMLAPSELAAQLEVLDAVITYDLHRDRLPQELFVPWIERGGGWLATSGSRAFGRTVGETRLEELACLERIAPTHTERDVILLVDGSGSMEGAAFEMVKSAGVALAEAALPGDAVSLRFFTTVLDEPLLLKARGAQSDVGSAAARTLLGARVPGRSTYIAESLRTLSEERAIIERAALVLMLTDGHERGNHAHPKALQESIRAQLAATDTTLVVVAVGAQPNDEYLHGFLAVGEDVRFARELEDLNRIFTRQVEDERQRRADPPIGVLSVPGSQYELAPGSLQPLASLWKTTVRRDASLNWVTEDGDPVLASKRVGLGRIAQFASQPRAGWADAWIDQRGLGEPAAFAPVLRWLSRRPRDVTRPRIRRRANGLELVGAPHDTAAILDVEVAPIDADALGQARFMRQVEPAGFPKPGRRFSAVSERGWWTDATRERGLVLRFPEPIGAVPLSAPNPLEFQARAPFDGRPSDGGPTAIRSSHRAQPLRSSPLGPALALTAAVLAALGLFLSVRSQSARVEN